MEFLNTSSPIIIFVYTVIVVLLIFISRKIEKPFMLAFLIFYNLFLLILHTGFDIFEFEGNQRFMCIAFDLVFLLLSFISFLWIDDINAKKKNLKSYDDSLSWFWDEF